MAGGADLVRFLHDNPMLLATCGERGTVVSCRCCATLVLLEQDTDVTLLRRYSVCPSPAKGHQAVKDSPCPPFAPHHKYPLGKVLHNSGSW